MKKINEADSRKLNGGLVLIGPAAIAAGHLPAGSLFYAYCTRDRVGIATNNFGQYATFRTMHRFS